MQYYRKQNIKRISKIRISNQIEIIPKKIVEEIRLNERQKWNVSK
jgi:hypothetical protein